MFDNLFLLPQHLLQTSPAIVLVMLFLAVLVGYFAEQSVARISIRSGLFIGKQQHVFVLLLGLVLMFVSTKTKSVANSMAPQSVVSVKTIGSISVAKDIVTFLDGLPEKAEHIMSFVPVRRYPVIVILVESLRHDLLKSHPEAIPFLKSFYEKHVSFDYAYATASHSNFSDLAFWYSQYPLRSGFKERYPIGATWRGTSLFGVFKNAGYSTAYISSQNEKWGNMINWLKTDDLDFFFHSEDYLGQTWENVHDLPGLAGMIQRGLATAGKIEDSETLRIASEWIDKVHRDKKGDGFFLGLNLQNTHYSYVIPPGGPEPYQPCRLGFKTVYYNWPENKKEEVRNRYLNAVVNIDSLLSKFAEFLKRKGLWNECMFVVVGDNGEAFYEHGFGNHSGPMYDEVVRTFAAIKLPESVQYKLKEIKYPISHIDIAATIPVLAGIPIPSSFQGLNLLASEVAARPVFMYSNAIVKQYGLVSWPWKLLLTEFPMSRIELYNLDEDPGETVEKSKDYPQQLEALKSCLMFWIQSQRLYYERDMFLFKSSPTYIRVGKCSHFLNNDIGVY